MNSISDKSTLASGLTLVILGALGFSTKSIIVKLAYQASTEIDAISLLALRMVFSLPFFLLVALWQHKKMLNIQPLHTLQCFQIIGFGLMGYYLASYFDFLGLQYISAGLERVILFLYPTFVVILSAIIYKRTVTAREILALGVSYSGMLLVFIDQLSTESTHLYLGAGLILASALVFACFTIGSGMMVKQIGSTRFTAYTMTVAGTAILIHFFCNSDIQLTEFPLDVYWLTLVMAVFSTVLPAFFMNAGIKRIGASSASIVSSSGPIATLILAYFILHETINATQMAGTFLVLLGVYTVGRVKS